MRRSRSSELESELVSESFCTSRSQTSPALGPACKALDSPCDFFVQCTSSGKFPSISAPASLLASLGSSPATALHCTWPALMQQEETREGTREGTREEKRRGEEDKQKGRTKATTSPGPQGGASGEAPIAAAVHASECLVASGQTSPKHHKHKARSCYAGWSAVPPEVSQEPQMSLSCFISRHMQ